MVESCPAHSYSAGHTACWDCLQILEYQADTGVWQKSNRIIMDEMLDKYIDQQQQQQQVVPGASGMQAFGHAPPAGFQAKHPGMMQQVST